MSIDAQWAQLNWNAYLWLVLVLIRHRAHIQKNNYASGCYRLRHGDGTQMRRWEDVTLLTSVREEYSSTAAFISLICRFFCKSQRAQDNSRFKIAMFASMQHDCSALWKQQWPKKKQKKNKAARGTDLLNQSFLFAKNSIKRVNLHLWKAKDNDGTVNNSL